MIELQHTDIDADRLHNEILCHCPPYHPTQLSLTSVTGEDDWTCSTGRISECKFNERLYRTVNKSLRGTYIEECINRYPEYYRWRVMFLAPMSTYSIHRDSLSDGMNNYRLHIPVRTNKDSFLCFYDDKPQSGETLDVRYEHLETGNSYRVNTTGLHTAINHGYEMRIHIVGVTYESSNNWTH